MKKRIDPTAKSSRGRFHATRTVQLALAGTVLLIMTALPYVLDSRLTLLSATYAGRLPQQNSRRYSLEDCHDETPSDSTTQLGRLFSTALWSGSRYNGLVPAAVIADVKVDADDVSGKLVRCKPKSPGGDSVPDQCRGPVGMPQAEPIAAYDLTKMVSVCVRLCLSV